MDISYDYFKIFYYAAKYGSFSKAAQVLMSNQPNVSRTMGLLEESLGCRLFVRSGKGVSLTPEGEQLLAHVEVAHAHLQAAEQELRGRSVIASGSVAIGASDTAMNLLLMPVLRKFKLAYPGVRIQIHSYATPEAMSAVSRSEVDFAVSVATGDPSPAGLITEDLIFFKDVFVGAGAYKALSKTSSSLRELAEYPLIALAKTTTSRNFFNRLFEREGIRPQPEIEVESMNQILPMVTSGLGIGLIAEPFAREAIELGEVCLIPTKTLVPKQSICLIRQKHSLAGPAAEALMQMIRQQARELQGVNL